MPQFIALFRGINVGGKNVLTMKELKRDLESFDLSDVRTYIQSGNVVFQTARKTLSTLGDEIAEKIETRHGFRPQILILSRDRFERSMQLNPFPDAESDPKTLHLYFLSSKPKTPDMKAVTDLKSPAERFQLRENIFYLHAPEGIGRSKLASGVEKVLGVTATARNWRTTQKLWELAGVK